MTNSSTPFPLGAFLNAPDGSTAANMAEYQTNYASFTSLMGTAPAFLDYFTDYTEPVSDWISNASWQAWSAVQAGAGTTSATPVIALPMCSTAPGALSPDAQYQQIVTGADDSVYKGIVDAWAAEGFKTLVFRPGWEMNIPGPTYAGDSAQSQADWVAAFQHIYTVLHQAAAAVGVTVTVVWNPSTTNYSNAEATTNLYPGNAYVDAIGADAYADALPYSNTPGGVYQDWATGGTDATAAQFISNPINMEHYWTYPAATVWANDSSGGHSQSLDSLIAFAEQQGKPFDIPEAGAGNSNGGNDVSDEAAYPAWLAAQLTAAQAAGEKIGFVNLWDSNGGGNYEFSNASNGKPLEAAAFAKAFGAQTATATTPASTPTVTLTVTASANDTVVKGTTGAIIDASGNTWTITSINQVAINGITDTSTSAVIELAYVKGAVWEENTSALWWGRMLPSPSWSLGGGTSTSPLPNTSTPSANDAVIKGTTGTITDASGNTWTITTASQVAIDGTTDTSTSGVIELAYVNGAVWEENTSALWWGRSLPSPSWSLGGGTSTSPLPNTSTPSANDTVITGTTGAITDASGNTWTITSGSQVAIDGTTDTSTSGVIELAYVNGGVWEENTSDLWWGRTLPSVSWSLGGGTSSSPLPVASSSIALDMSEDAWQGDAQFTVSVDGTQVGGTMTASALHSTGDSSIFILPGSWSTGSHSVQISFINDAYGGSSTADRNLYVNGIAFNGTTQSNTTAALLSNGTDSFTVGGSTAAATAPADTLTLNLAEDAWNGNAQFTLTIDGKQISTTQNVTALHSAGAWEAFSYAGNFGAGSHTVGVSFTNDAYGGSASADRNLYINGISVNGTQYGSGVTPMMANGTANFTVTTTH